MQVYLESNQKTGAELYSDNGDAYQRLRAEDAFLTYLSEDFFCQKDARYAVWVHEGVYKAALRIEPYMDGILIEALETSPHERRKGYAYRLLTSTLDYLKRTQYSVAYSHIRKTNIASLRVHRKCGFQKCLEYAKYIDGTVTYKSYTMCINLM